MLNDNKLEWRVAFYGITVMFLLYSIAVVLEEVEKQNYGVKFVLFGWFAFFNAFDVVAVFMGYNMHNKGIMAVVFTLILVGISLVITEICIKQLE